MSLLPVILREAGRSCRRKTWVGSRLQELNCTVGERMRGSHDLILKENVQLAGWVSIHEALDSVPSPPVLLALATDIPSPPAAIYLAIQAHQDKARRRPESPPVRIGPEGVYCTAVRTAPPFHPQGFVHLVKVAGHIAVAP